MTDTKQTIPTVDVNRPAFAFNPAARELVSAGKCVSCKNAVTAESFTTTLHRTEYCISGICPVCQDIFFARAPVARAPKKLGGV